MNALRALRQDLRDRRMAIDTRTRIASAMAVASTLLALPEVTRARQVAGYWAVRGELPLLGVVTRLPADSHYCLPVLHPTGSLRFAPWQPGAPILSNRFGIPEPANGTQALAPEQLDVVLMPLLGFTRAGDRLGTGGGWYDRSFAFRKLAPAPPLLVGVGFACQELDHDWIPQPWDVPLDAIVTERELIRSPRPHPSTA